MSFGRRTLFLAAGSLAASISTAQPASAQSAGQNPNLIVYQGTAGPGAGKHIVFIAGDHEYRSEETLPMLARIMARRYGFTCSVFFTTNPTTGEIDPESSHIRLAALDKADLLVIFTRFKDFSDAEMKHVVDYLARGGPVVGLRTATHAFQIQRPDAGLREVLLEGHGGVSRRLRPADPRRDLGVALRHQSQAEVTPRARERRGEPPDSARREGCLGAVGRLHRQADRRQPRPRRRRDPRRHDSRFTARCRKDAAAGCLVPDLHLRLGQAGRAFATTHGASEDIVNDGFRRMMVNAMLWGAGLDAGIRADGPIALVGPYHPTTYNFKGFIKGMKPSDFAAWDSAIPKK